MNTLNASQTKQQVVAELVNNPPNDGPWTTGNQINNRVGHAQYDARDASGEWFVTMLFYAPRNARANARLMAAAPQLLEACQMALAQLETTMPESAWLVKIRSAIRAATGPIDLQQ
jgi:hypothetical protein